MFLVYLFIYLFVYLIDDVTPREGQWWVAKSLVTGLEGFIPCNYVARADNMEMEK